MFVDNAMTEKRNKDMTKDLRHFPFAQLDVFSSQPFEGNSLAVVPDGRGLSDQQMQAVAREMNLSETTFILPRDKAIERERGVRARIFTVQEELPFAGHPTLGTAFWLRGSTGASEVVLELNVGKVPIRFEDVSGKPAFGEMTQMEPKFGPAHDRETVVRATSLRDGNIDPSLPVPTVFHWIAVYRGAASRPGGNPTAELDLKSASEYLERSGGGKFFYFVTRETVDREARLHARMIFYNGEDPATGSAAGCAAAWMVANGVAQADERVLIEQGLEMLRPSRIFVRAGRVDDKVVNVRVGGNAVEVLPRRSLFLKCDL